MRKFKLMLPVGQTCTSPSCLANSPSPLCSPLIIPPSSWHCWLASKIPHALGVPPTSLALSSSWSQYCFFLISLPFKGESLSFPCAFTSVLTSLKHTTLTLTHFQPWVLTEFQTLISSHLPAIFSWMSDGNLKFNTSKATFWSSPF